MQKKRSRKTNVTTIAEEYMQTVTGREDTEKQDGAKEVKRVTARKFSLGSSKYTSWSDV